MQYLVDTSILARALDANHPDRVAANDAVRKLVDQGHEPVVVPQVLYEWWAVATRPLNVNGLGMDIASAASVLATLEAQFPVRQDGPRLFATWRYLIVQHGVSGKQAHDARIAAAMQLHELSHLLTFNARDFSRFPFLTVVTPTEVLAVKSH